MDIGHSFRASMNCLRAFSWASVRGRPRRGADAKRYRARRAGDRPTARNQDRRADADTAAVGSFGRPWCAQAEIGRASCRVRAGKYVSVSVVAVVLNKKK